MSPPEVMARGGPPDDEAVDRGVLVQAVEAQVTSNRARAQVLEALGRFHGLRVEEVKVSRGGQPAFFALTALEATKAELGPLLGMGDRLIESNLDLVETLTRYFPRMWAQCLQGRLDLGRANVAVTYLQRIVDPEDRRAYAESVEDFLDSQDDPSARLHPVRYLNLQQACWRRGRRYPQVTKQQSFREAFARRRVRLRTDADGMSSLVCTTRVDKGLQADYRLTLIAKKRAEADGEKRTIEQLRADTMVDLILGRVSVAVGDADLEDGETAEGVPVADPVEWRDVGKFARPIVNVTVPITTLMGLGDTPGMLAGTLIPPEVARTIAEDQDSVWYRLLTDPRGRFVELSASSYAPTEAQWRWVVAENPQCVWPMCRRPATAVDLDHREPFPHGPTSTRNLQPLCEPHHKVKHSQGFRVVREVDGSYTWTSRFGMVSKKPAPEYPPAEWPTRPVVRRCADGSEEPADRSTAGEAGTAGVERGAETVLAPDSPMERRFADLIAGAA